MAESKGKVVNILCTHIYEKQLKEILDKFAKEDFSATKNFKMYLDTVIINAPTKEKKYKKSIYFNDENIKDIVHKGFHIPFYIDKENDTYLILGIIKS